MAITQVTDFWSTVLLEMRQPMTAAMGQAQRAQQLLQADPERASAALDQVVAQIWRLDQLLDALRERVHGNQSTAPEA